jgi:hypothetical protein
VGGSPVTDGRSHQSPGNGDPQSAQPGVRVLPAGMAREAVTAAGSRPRGERPPKVLRPERLTSLVDLVPLVRTGRPVILCVDRLEDRDRLRAIDVATGIALAFDATVAKLNETPGVSIVSTQLQGSFSIADLEAPAGRDAARDVTEVGEKSATDLCVFCEVRDATVDRDPPLDVVVLRDGSRARPPRIGLCARCHGSVRNWRFAIAWCSTCERWGRRGVISSCGLPYGF